MAPSVLRLCRCQPLQSKCTTGHDITQITSGLSYMTWMRKPAQGPPCSDGHTIVQTLPKHDLRPDANGGCRFRMLLGYIQQYPCSRCLMRAPYAGQRYVPGEPCYMLLSGEQQRTTMALCAPSNQRATDERGYWLQSLKSSSSCLLVGAGGGKGLRFILRVQGHVCARCACQGRTHVRGRLEEGSTGKPCMTPPRG